MRVLKVGTADVSVTRKALEILERMRKGERLKPKDQHEKLAFYLALEFRRVGEPKRISVVEAQTFGASKTAKKREMIEKLKEILGERFEELFHFYYVPSFFRKPGVIEKEFPHDPRKFWEEVEGKGLKFDYVYGCEVLSPIMRQLLQILKEEKAVGILPFLSIFEDFYRLSRKGFFFIEPTTDIGPLIQISILFSEKARKEFVEWFEKLRKKKELWKLFENMGERDAKALINEGSAGSFVVVASKVLERLGHKDLAEETERRIEGWLSELEGMMRVFVPGLEIRPVEHGFFVIRCVKKGKEERGALEIGIANGRITKEAIDAIKNRLFPQGLIAHWLKCEFERFGLPEEISAIDRFTLIQRDSRFVVAERHEVIEELKRNVGEKLREIFPFYYVPSYFRKPGIAERIREEKLREACQFLEKVERFSFQYVYGTRVLIYIFDQVEKLVRELKQEGIEPFISIFQDFYRISRKGFFFIEVLCDTASIAIFPMKFSESSKREFEKWLFMVKEIKMHLENFARRLNLDISGLLEKDAKSLIESGEAVKLIDAVMNIALLFRLRDVQLRTEDLLVSCLKDLEEIVKLFIPEFEVEFVGHGVVFRCLKGGARVSEQKIKFGGVHLEEGDSVEKG